VRRTTLANYLNRSQGQTRPVTSAGQATVRRAQGTAIGYALASACRCFWRMRPILELPVSPYIALYGGAAVLGSLTLSGEDLPRMAQPGQSRKPSGAGATDFHSGAGGFGVALQ